MPRIQVVSQDRNADTPGNDYQAACIARIEHLLRARSLLWQDMIAAHKPDHLWGVPQVPHGEVNGPLALPFLGILAGHRPSRAVEEEIGAAVAMNEMLAARRASAVDSRLRGLEESFALSPVERDVLLLSVLPELDVRYRRLLGYLMDDAAQAWPTIEFTAACLEPLHGTLHEVLGPERPLLAQGLIEMTPQPGGASGPRAQRGLKPCFEVLDWLRGGEGIDRETIADAELVRAEARPEWGWSEAVAGAGRLCLADPALVVVAHGLGCADIHPFIALAHEAGRPLLTVPIGPASDYAMRARAASRSARLYGAILHMRIDVPVDAPPSDPPLRVGSWLGSHMGPIVLGTPRQLSSANLDGLARRPCIEIAVDAPDFSALAAFWAERLLRQPLAADIRPRELALQLADSFRLGYGAIGAAIGRALATARLRDAHAPALTRSDLTAACRRDVAPQGTTLARHIMPDGLDLDMADLIVPSATRRHIDNLARRLGQRRRVLSTSGIARRLPFGTATVALFTGAAGTGKTLAAMLVARHLGVDLFKAALSGLVSKYIGETEQRLDRLFAAAEASNGILFFDEADALFGKRGEIKEARDRWANLETSYLLQRIEEFDGAVILATNLRQNIDDAFLRRIDVAIDFPLPDATLRLRLWQSLIPDNVAGPPDAELARLAAMLPLAGGHIKTIVVDAVHRAYAADEGNGERVRMTLRHIVEAAAQTYEKLGRTVGPTEFAPEWLGWLRE